MESMTYNKMNARHEIIYLCSTKTQETQLHTLNNK